MQCARHGCASSLRRGLTSVLAASSLAVSGDLTAQEPIRSATTAFIGAGFARGGLDIPNWGAGYGYGYGPVLVLQVSKVKRPWRTWALELQVEPFKTPNVVNSEHFRAVTLLAQRYFGPLALGVGIQSRNWGGEHSVVSSDGGPALGIGLAPKVIDLGSITVTGDVVWRVSGGDEIVTSLVGLRAMIQLSGGGR